MANILVVVSSARPGRAADNVLEIVKKNIESRDGISATVADLKDIKLPFFDDANVPASEEFNPQHDSVKAWAQMIADADGVLFLTPEYNHSLNAIQKNAIDWVYKEWTDKPVSIVGYGWTGASEAIKTAKQVFDDSMIKTELLPTPTLLRFMKEISVDGSAIDEETVQSTVTATLDELVSKAAA
jgi:NAD(P)H-dependent FMN reductase